MMSEKIKIAMIKRNGMRVKELAEKLNTSPSNLTNKFKRNNFTEKELENIASALNCTLKISLIDKETGEILI